MVVYFHVICIYDTFQGSLITDSFLRFLHLASETHLQTPGVGGPFSFIFLEKILGDSRFFSKKFTKMGYLFELAYFRTILKK